jgi:putative methyltransferase (TIGR04325 family)
VKIFRVLVKDFLPPAIFRLLYKIIFRKRRYRLQGYFASWKEASVYSTGYDDPQIVARVLDSTLKVKRGDAVYERDSVIFNQIEYNWPITAALMMVAAKNRGKLNVLDFGGSLGSSYFQNLKFLQTLPEVRWNIVEQLRFVNAGKANIQDGQIRFYETINDCLKENQPNVVLLSSILQYLQNPEKILNEVTGLTIDHILIDRTSFTADGSQQRLYIQKVSENIYKASYPIWLFNERELVEFITTRGYEVVESFGALDNLDIRGIWRGYIFSRTRNHAG